MADFKAATTKKVAILVAPGLEEIEALAARARALDAHDTIDRDAVWALKEPALRTAFRHLGAGQADEVAALHAACTLLRKIGIDAHMARIQRQSSFVPRTRTSNS